MDKQKGKCWRELVQRFGVKAVPTDYLCKPNRVLEHTVRVVMPPSDENTVYKRQQSRTSSSDDKYVFP